MSSFWMANCTFISPTTLSARASSTVCRSMSATISGLSECGGSEQAELPECTPASSICSITPQMNTSLPSASASTSTSMASRR